MQSEGDALEETPVVISLNHNIEDLVQNIINHQICNPRYDYASQEQIGIDNLIYCDYGLISEDIREVENWYARRYQKLVSAQRRNLEEYE